MNEHAHLAWWFASWSLPLVPFFFLWRARANRYEQALKLARGLILMDRADYALHHIKAALKRR